MALQNQDVARGSVDGFHLGAHDQTGVVSAGLVAARNVNPVVLPINWGKIKVNFNQFLLKTVATGEFGFQDDFSHGVIIA